MIAFHEKKWHYSPESCCSCGICVGVCPVDALKYADSMPVNTIVRDAQKCLNCGLCAVNCPMNMERHFPEEVWLTKLQSSGFYLTASPDSDQRFRASSGGSIRYLAEYLLRQGEVDAVYSLRSLGGRYVGDFLTAADEVHAMPNSQYRPLFWGFGIRQSKPQWRTVAVIGLPCQVTAFQKYFSVHRPELKIIAVSIGCRQNKNRLYEKFVRLQLGAPLAGEEQEVSFRGNGWPGFASYRERQVPYVSRPFVRKMFTVPGCHHCDDFLNIAGSDLTFLDPWGILSFQEEHAGMNLCIALTETGKALQQKVFNGRQLTFHEALPAINLPEIREKRQECKYYDRQNIPRPMRLFFAWQRFRVKIMEKLFLKFFRSRLLLYADRVLAVMERIIKKSVFRHIDR